MLRVLQECDNAASDFQPDPVHDLRVALRRCRSLADGMMAMDPDREWKSMKKAGKRLFQSLGSLRDVQIMAQWIEQLGLGNAAPASSSAGIAEAVAGSPEHPGDPAEVLLQILRSREIEHKRAACTALKEFDRKQWRSWAKSLPRRAARIRPGSAVFRHLALERWTAARELHARSMRTLSPGALHALRIAIKRFRYIVENFLPAEHELWGSGLKRIQDLLGDVHDLDVLWATAAQEQIFPAGDLRNTWRARMRAARSQRLDEYRQKTRGPQSLWNIWRARLPQGRQIHDIATRRMQLWANALDPDFAHSKHVARLALELYDGLNAAGWLGKTTTGTPDGAARDARESLYAAALLHDVGKARGKKGHHKRSMAWIRAYGAPLGWKLENVERAALVSRFHCGALPARSHKALRELPGYEQKDVIRLAAILRLANALDAGHDGHIRGLKVEHPQPANPRADRFRRKAAGFAKPPVLVIAAEGYRAGSPTAQEVAAERYLLELVVKRPVVIRGIRPSRSGIRSSRLRRAS